MIWNDHVSQGTSFSPLALVIASDSHNLLPHLHIHSAPATFCRFLRLVFISNKMSPQPAHACDLSSDLGSWLRDLSPAARSEARNSDVPSLN